MVSGGGIGVVIGQPMANLLADVAVGVNLEVEFIRGRVS